MNTKAQLEAALKDAMRSHDDLRKRTIRMVLSAVQFAEIERGSPLEEPAVVAIVQKEVKSRREAIEEAQRANRPDLVQASQAEIGVLEQFLPQQMSPAELESLARAAIAETGATSPQAMGQVMKVLMPRLQGRAPGDQVSAVVRRLLQG
jgi:uncharacterized protein